MENDRDQSILLFIIFFIFRFLFFIGLILLFLILFAFIAMLVSNLLLFSDNGLIPNMEQRRQLLLLDVFKK
jgi:hypothetical protein